MFDFLEDHDIIYSKQFGFRKRHSTTRAIIALTEKVSMALDSGNIVGGVFLDLKTAFDCVSHDILLNKLNAYGIRGNLMQWFQSYLSARSQYVIYNGIKSSFRNITHGVPLPMVGLFTRNYELHNHYTRQSQSLHAAVGRNEAIYKVLHFMAFEFGITYLQKSQLTMTVLNILRSYLSKITQFHIE